MDGSGFGESLFDEFDREDGPSDKLLMHKIRKDISEQVAPGKEVVKAVSKDSKNGTFDCSSDSSTDSEEAEPEKGTQYDSATKHVIEQLTKENRLRKLLYTDRLFSIDEGPILEIIFMNKPFSRKYRTEIEDFLGHLIERMKYEQDDFKMASTSGRQEIICVAGKSLKTPTPLEKLRQMETGMVIGCGHYYKEFMIDAMGWPLVEYNPSVTDGWFIPSYEQCFRNAIPCDSDDEDDLKPAKYERPKRSCFNCGGEHTLTECQERRNPMRIREAMQAFKNQKASPQASLKSRYHDDVDPRFAEFKAGTISQSLREAMGLYDRQLPDYVYKMRYLGYPPGWLEAAKVETSGLAMFDSQGKELNDDLEQCEDGEVTDSTVVKQQYNLDKLVEYPGFNAAMPEGFRDECHRLNMPPLNPAQSKEALALFLKPVDAPSSGRKRKKYNSQDEGETPDKKLKVEDMELDSQDEDGDSSQATPSIEDLELQKRLIQEQLAMSEGDSDCVIIDSGTESQDESFIPPMPPTPEQPPLPPGTPPVTPVNQQTPNTKDGFKSPLPVSNNGTPSRVASLPATPQSATPNIQTMLKTPSTGGSIEIKFGTPINHEESPTTTKGLPGLTKWSEGVSQHIPFENLPDATGNYSKMKKLIDNIKKKDTC